ncbi:MAG: sigma-54-dependent Fis family transcriptional regulator [Lentisphaerae bacterium]|nr:sigma-54-dependent Fis family transcriptional regulator [Lentisphaerota bacterium]
MARRATILIVEDEKNTREGLERALSRHYQILLADSAERALVALDETRVDIILSDLRLPGMDGLALVKRALAHDAQPICVLLTAYGSIEAAVAAVKAGAYDFLTKPVNLDQLELVLQRALRSRQLESENKSLRTQLDKKFGLETILGTTPVMEELFKIIRQVAPSRATVLIQGESGTGKELVANAIHGLSPRARGPFIAVHCAALPPTLLESELFGHEKGAFTGAFARRRGRFELAEGGTLFLDEISEIDPSIQVKLLRVLEERKFERVGGQETLDADIRLITATNRDLSQLAQTNKFRQDLFFRLNVVTITVPPLRDRLSDIPLLARNFIEEFARENNKPIMNLAPETLNALMAYPWPGNVRELRNAIEGMIVLAQGPELAVANLPEAIRPQTSLTPNLEIKPAASLRDASRQMIVAALEANRNNRTQAAKQLGISRRTLHRKLHEFELPCLRGRKRSTEATTAAGSITAEAAAGPGTGPDPAC